MRLEIDSYVLEAYISTNVGGNPPKLKLTIQFSRT